MPHLKERRRLLDGDGRGNHEQEQPRAVGNQEPLGREVDVHHEERREQGRGEGRGRSDCERLGNHF